MNLKKPEAQDAAKPYMAICMLVRMSQVRKLVRTGRDGAGHAGAGGEP